MLQSRRVAFAALASIALTGAVPAGSDEQIVTVPLNGEAELNFAHPDGGTGDPDGYGAVKLTIAPQKREVCFDIEVDGVATPILAYIHSGPAKRIGRPSSVFSTASEAILAAACRPTRERCRTYCPTPRSIM